MTDARKTIFREKLRSFADIHKSVEEDYLIALFQKLCLSVVQLDWTSTEVDETKLTLAQNLICVDKYYKRWKEAWNNLAAWNPRSPKSLQHNTNNNTNNNSTSPTHTNSPPEIPLLKKIELTTDFEDKDFIATQRANSSTQLSSPRDNNNTSPPLPSSSISSSHSPPSGTWTSPEITRSKLDLKKRNADIIHYTIESKYKAIKELVERTAKSLNEKR